MAGTRQLEQTIVGKSPGEDDADATRFFNQKIVLPVVQATRNTMNQLVGDVLEVDSSSGILAKYGVILADATDGAMVLTLIPPKQSHRSYFFAKTDASLNTVTLQVSDGSLISGAATLVLSQQWQSVILVSDDTQYVAFAQPTTATPTEPEIHVDLSTDQNNWSPTGWSTARNVYVNVTASCNVTGMDANVTQKRKTIIHVGTVKLVLGFLEEKLSSTAANRIRMPNPNDLYMLKGWAQDFLYDSTDQRWRPV